MGGLAILKEYVSKITELLNDVVKNQGETMKNVATKITETIENEGIIHLFGCGHSHILTEEVFYRAGGLVPISPIFYEDLMLHKGAVTSAVLERKKNFADSFMKKVDIRPEDTVIVISTSGINPVPIDVAIFAKEKGAYVIGITSLEYSKSQTPRHKSGKRLYQSVDAFFNNLSVKGDAILSHDKLETPFAPTSTIIGATILNGLFAEVIATMAEKGKTPPIFLSGNSDGADEHNKRLVQKYKDRIPLLS